MKETDNLFECTEFEWDEHNSEKNWIKHRVSNPECEEVFLNYPLIVKGETGHLENRFYALGHTDNKKPLFVVFTIREKKVRVISARNMSRKERKIYHEKKNSEI